MSARINRAGWAMLRWVVAVGVLIAAVVGLWTVIRHSILPAGDADKVAALWAAGGTTLLALALASMSAVRVRHDLRDVRERHGREAGAAAAAMLKTGVVGGMAVRGIVRGSADLLDWMSFILSALFSVVAVGWWHETVIHPVVPWASAVVLGLVAAVTVARRVAAMMRVDLAWWHVRHVPGWPVWGLAGAGLGAAGMAWLATTYGRIEGPSLLTAALAGVGLVLGLAGARFEGATNGRKLPLASQLAATMGVSENRLGADGDIRWSVKKDGTVTIYPPLPAAVVSALAGGLESRLASTMADYELGPGASATEGLALVPASPETRAARLAAESTGGLAVEVRTAPDEPGQPTDREHWKLALGTRGSAALALTQHAHSRGLDMLKFRPEELTALFGRLDPTTRLVRERIAEVLRCEVHDIALRVEGTEERDVDVVTITRAPLPAGDARMKVLRELVLALPGGNAGWLIEDDPAEHRTVLTWAPKPVLPTLVPYADLLPGEVDHSDRDRLPLGVAADGSTVHIDFKAGPHALVVGGTGSGKSVSSRLLLAGALARGYDVIVVDAVKRAAGLKAFGPWAKMVMNAPDHAKAAAVLEAVYAEVQRRVDLIDSVDGEDWRDLPSGSVRPWLVFVDEFSSLVEADPKPAGDPSSPEVQEWKAIQAAKGKIISIIGKIAREARSSGIRLVISTQRPDASQLPGQVRDQLGSIVQLVPAARPPSREALAMVFPTEYAPLAVEQIDLLGDGRTPGFALSYREGGGVHGFRVGLIEPADIVPYLERIGAPHAEPLKVAADASVRRPPREGEIITPVPAPVIEEDLGTIDLGLEDLDLDIPAPEPEPAESGEEEFEFDVEEAAPQPVKEEREEDPAAAWGF